MRPMNNHQRKREQARAHNSVYRRVMVSKFNNDYARNNFTISLSYFIRVVHGNSTPNVERKQMRDYDKLLRPEGLNDEQIAEGITMLNNRSNEQGKYMIWSESIQELSETFDLNGIQASYVFVRWTEYVDNRKTLAKAINFDK